MKQIRLAAIFLFLGVFTTPLFTKDFGILLDFTPGYESMGGGFDMDNAVFSGVIKPWFSSSLGETMDLYLSAGASLKYELQEFTIAPEIYHSEFTWQIREDQTLGIGRLYYSDPLGFIAEGLFDGISWTRPAGKGTIALGAYYTGLLYKKTAYITITGEELISYREELDYGDFSETYFAPRRVLGSLGYSTVLGETIRLNLALLGQVDLRNKETYYSSEYLVAKFSIPYKSFYIEAGGAAEFIETSGENFLFGLAGDVKFSWMIPTAIQDRLSLGARYGSGKWADSVFAEFRPLTTEPQGKVLRANLAGLSIIEAAYTVRLHKTFTLEASASYFIRNDLITYLGLFTEEQEYFLGGEAYSQFIWNPMSDIQFKLGGGAFLPKLGNTSPASKPLWLVNLNIIFALY